MDDILFFKILMRKQPDLMEVAIKKRYTFIVPLAKFITPNMLTRSFYDNHTFYQCEYDENMYINLNGKVLELSENRFVSFLGFKKMMLFNIIDASSREVDQGIVKVVYADNVIDESVYNQGSHSASISKKEIIKRFSSREEYVKYFSNLTKIHDELREIQVMLTELVEKLQNNYILMKNHVYTYSKYFQELGCDFRNEVSNRLTKYKLDDEFNFIIYELTESLVFSKIGQYLYFNIKQFKSDEETDLKTKLKNLQTEFNFTTYKLDHIFNKCKFKNAINEFRKISNFSTPFEKLV